MTEIVTDKEVEKALDYLRDQALPTAKAIAESTYMVEYRKYLKAKLMGQSNESVVAAQERFAYSHDDYKAHLQNMQTAIEKAKEHEFLTKAATAKIDVWRAQEYRNRQMEKI